MYIGTEVYKHNHKIKTTLSTKELTTKYNNRDNYVGQVVKEGFSEKLTFRLILKDN